jgi:hypothetical protein
MPSHKLQHYVPRCHFKPFTLDQAGNAINLYNISRDAHFKNAPIKGQCAKSYFYGKNLIVEEWLQAEEEQYATAVHKVQKHQNLTERDANALRTFAYLQFCRTDMALKRRKMAQDASVNILLKAHPDHRKEYDLDLDAYSLMMFAMDTYMKSRDYVDDLKVAIVLNNTKRDFLTSDDPAVLVNKFHSQRLHHSNFGIGSSGVLFFMPLAPSSAVICYDGNVYAIPNKTNYYVSANNESDILAVNELQYLKAVDNLYYSKWGDRVRVAEEYGHAAKNRLVSWHQVTTFVKREETKDGIRYGLATEEEIRSGQHLMINTAAIYPIPSRWVSVIKYRTPIRTYSNGSAIGHVRNPDWLR